MAKGFPISVSEGLSSRPGRLWLEVVLAAASQLLFHNVVWSPSVWPHFSITSLLLLHLLPLLLCVTQHSHQTSTGRSSDMERWVIQRRWWPLANKLPVAICPFLTHHASGPVFSLLMWKIRVGNRMGTWRKSGLQVGEMTALCLESSWCALNRRQNQYRN